MMYTKNPLTQIYKPDGGVHAQSPIRGLGTPVAITGATRDITGHERGICYQLRDVTNAWVATNDLAISPTPPPSTDPPPISTAKLLEVVTTFNVQTGKARTVHYMDDATIRVIES